MILILIGVFLRSNDASQTYWTFEDVVTQIGLGYVFLFLLWGRGFKNTARCGRRDTVRLLAAVCPLADRRTRRLGVWRTRTRTSSPASRRTGTSTPIPRTTSTSGSSISSPARKRSPSTPRATNTLNSIPSLAIMIFGLCCGELLRGKGESARKLCILLTCGGAGVNRWLAAGGHWHLPTGKEDVDARIHALQRRDLRRLPRLSLLADRSQREIKRWTFPFVVMGMNSIALYIMIWLIPFWMQRHAPDPHR